MKGERSNPYLATLHKKWLKKLVTKEIVTPNNTDLSLITKIEFIKNKSRELLHLVPMFIISLPVELWHITHILSDKVTFKLTRVHL